MSPEEIGLFETKTHLSELIEKVQEGSTFIITKRGKRVAELRPIPKERLPLERGCVKNQGYWMATDFDDTPDDFAEYL
jgi:prevent-host-death family protein